MFLPDNQHLCDNDNKLEPVLPDNQRGLLIPVVFHCLFSHLCYKGNKLVLSGKFCQVLPDNQNGLLITMVFHCLFSHLCDNDNKLEPVLPDNQHGLLIAVVFHCLFFLPFL